MRKYLITADKKSDFKYDTSLLKFRADEKKSDHKITKKASNNHDFQMIRHYLTKTMLIVSKL